MRPGALSEHTCVQGPSGTWRSKAGALRGRPLVPQTGRVLRTPGPVREGPSERVLWRGPDDCGGTSLGSTEGRKSWPCLAWPPWPARRSAQKGWRAVSERGNRWERWTGRWTGRWPRVRAEAPPSPHPALRIRPFRCRDLGDLGAVPAATAGAGVPEVRASPRPRGRRPARLPAASGSHGPRAASRQRPCAGGSPSDLRTGLACGRSGGLARYP